MMLKITASLTYPGKSPQGLVKAFKSAVVKANVAVGEYWRNNILPIHFTKTGFVRFFYQPRTAKYQYRKLRKYGHENPLMFTGEAQREIMSKYSIKASPKYISVKLPRPRVFNLSNRIDMPPMDKEAVRVVDADLAELSKVAMSIYKEEIKKAKTNYKEKSA